MKGKKEKKGVERVKKEWNIIMGNNYTKSDTQGGKKDIISPNLYRTIISERGGGKNMIFGENIYPCFFV